MGAASRQSFALFAYGKASADWKLERGTRGTMVKRCCETCRWWTRHGDSKLLGRDSKLLGRCDVPLEAEPMLAVCRQRTADSWCPDKWAPHEGSKDDGDDGES
jgi:hypothetical protein